MLELFLSELFEWRRMQTDPNFGNFRVRIDESGEDDKLLLLDFGAMRLLPDGFAGEFCDEKSLDSEVTYSFEQDGKFFLIERVPARVCSETGEQYSPPKTVEHIQGIIKNRTVPKKTIETPVYEFV